MVKVISLKNEIEKRQNVINELKDTMNFSFFDAIDGRNLLSMKYFKYLRMLKGRAKKRGYITPSELGCTLSHFSVYHDFLNSDKEWLLVLEDDITINSNLFFLIESIINQNYSDYINILGGQEGLKRPRLIEFLFRKNIRILSSPFYGFFLYRTCSYLVSRAVVERLYSTHKNFCYLADDWGNIAIQSNIRGFTYCKIFSHPEDLSNSRIECERK
ncbi:glycosyltransferase family 25 protein [Glaesserella parasuis]|uniref:glycosyltransferase family 25 protein n=1 Tax=Glaesserella parasuis TaxID=738 RepID=UPI00042A9341|nr:glycosyltransferase family 25 protein [Glaesserella parasuis]MDG6266654.1 glycosyltransferase family 25 protein [Glaesserella parasuis]MDG6455855.1 glycosyltransferase family 25 protein [Glaesserella parasuis]MDO9897467.1 glycosyltransferase family 25 protein [Glaesserella parasuis]MDP0080771.1 glycosyltransferase family 25 protein [Glaesserella parasuis]MDP0085119.1 glycosyltransferase family 25 protein [Glaesserella parasuis]